MPIAPIITFKAGQCEVDDAASRPLRVRPQPQPGYLYLYSDDDLTHFCWRKRDQSLDEPELDLVMVPTDATFVPYVPDPSQPTAKTNGRIFVLKFASSSQRHFFWMQSKPQSRDGDPSWFSPRDGKIGEVVNKLLQGEEVNVMSELASVRRGGGGGRRGDDDDDDDETMEDVGEDGGPQLQQGSGSGGAGPDATGGDIREEGEESREGGADGARAASSSTSDAAAAVRNLLDSLRGHEGLSGGQQQQQADLPYPCLSHLLPPSITVPMIDGASPEHLDTLLGFLPPTVILLATTSAAVAETREEASAAVVEAAKASLSADAKRSLLKRVLRSPQFHQALGTLTMALGDGGLPGVADALGVRVENGGYVVGGQVPLGGGHAVKAFVEGVKKTAKEKRR